MVSMAASEWGASFWHANSGRRRSGETEGWMGQNYPSQVARITGVVFRQCNEIAVLVHSDDALEG